MSPLKSPAFRALNPHSVWLEDDAFFPLDEEPMANVVQQTIHTLDEVERFRLVASHALRQDDAFWNGA